MPRLDTLLRTSRYLAALPAGLDSYPDARVKGSLVVAVVEGAPASLRLEELPEPLRWMFEHSPTLNQWVPEVRLAALMHAVRDLAFEAEEEYLAWCEVTMGRLFRRPLHRIVLALSSPERMMRSASKAWETMRRGTSREMTEAGPNYNIGRLHYPPYLFDPLYVDLVRMGMVMAYRLSRAPDPRVEMIEWTPTHATLRAVYDARKEAR